MSRLLVVVFSPSEAAQCAGFAAKLGVPFDMLSACGPLSDSYGAEKLFSADLSSQAADAAGATIKECCGGYTHIASVSSMQSKDVMARVAGLVDAGMITDVIAAESPSVFKRPIVAGSMIATVEALSLPVVITFRPAGFPKAQPTGNSPSEQTLPASTSGRTRRHPGAARGGSRPDLSQAAIVVSGGRPLRDAQTFETVIGGLADALGGAVGATRAAVDSGIAANELQVGQTGKIVAPNLYIAAGISGSTQHMAGIKDSKTIVAVNKDPDAPIFDFADLGLVADLYEAIPAMRAILGK